MQFYGNLTLYKTPLDSSYKNVYDDYNDVDDYYNFLNSSFDNIVISETNIKSRNDANGHFSVQISGYTSMMLHDYNYISFVFIKSVGVLERNFAFITSIDSLNDGVTTKSCVLHCKLDAWSNNYLTMKEFSDNQQVYERGTFDMGKYGKYNHYQVKTPYYNPYFQEDIERLSAKGNDYTVLWLHVALSPSINVTYKEPDGSDPNPPYNDKKEAMCPSYPYDMYIPCAVYDKDSLTHYEHECSIYFRAFSAEPITNPYFMAVDTHGYYYLPKLTSDKIYNAEFTFFPAFNYSIERDIVQGVYPSHRFIIMPDTGDFANAVVYDSGVELKGYVARPWSLFYTRQSQFADDFDYLVPEILSDSAYSDRYLTTKNAIYNSEQEMFEYPFKYYSVVVGGKENPVIQKHDYWKRIHIYLGRRKQPVIQFLEQNMTSRVTKNSIPDIYSKSNGEIPTAVSQYTQYMNQEANRRALQIGKNLTSLLLNFGIGNYTSLSNDILNVTSQFAKEADLKNASYSYADVDHADVDLIIQNEVLVLLREADKSIEEVYEIAHEFHYNGVFVDGIVKSIFSIERDIFDVDKTKDCSLKCQMNEEDRKEIENAFNNGITRWHIRENDSVRPRFLISLNKEVSNLYMSIVNGGNN